MPSTSALAAELFARPALLPFDEDDALWTSRADSTHRPGLSAQELTARAEALAVHHGKPSRRGKPEMVHLRFRTACASLRASYRKLESELPNLQEASEVQRWLMDNAHVVDEQMRDVAAHLPRGFLFELPRLVHGPLQGAPRVYALALDYLRHTDARIELPSLDAYVKGYGKKQRLTMGELWAVPIMLRIGLVLMLARIAATASNPSPQVRARELALRIAPEVLAGGEVTFASDGQPQELDLALLASLASALRSHDLDSAQVHQVLQTPAAVLGALPAELPRLYHLQCAHDQLTVANCVTSMRTLSACDFLAFFEHISLVEGVLRRDPTGTYASSDARTRDWVRHAVEELAKRCALDEVDVAQAALEASQTRAALRAQGRGQQEVATPWVGHFLLGAGRQRFEQTLQARPAFRTRVRRFVQRRALLLYPLLMGLGVALISQIWWPALARSQLAPWLAVPLSLAFLIVASELALGLLNTLVVGVLPPRLLPKLDLRAAVGRERRTLVVVPTLFESAGSVARQVDALETRALANRDPDVYFALLGDFCDADSETTPQDAEIRAALRAAFVALNARWPEADGTPRFHYFLRPRVFDSSEQRFLGWERKRGKLEELNAAIVGNPCRPFLEESAPASLLASIRYVITLDADTDLPIGAAKKLIATIAHPENRAEVDLVQRRVVRGYGIIQPRVGNSPESVRASRYARLFGGQVGIDPYTSAVSDVYQDLFSEGSFVGKGIYDPHVFAQVMADRVPADSLLSHDLFEGVFLRCAFASDIALFDDQPSSYRSDALRKHRWIRGDFQLAPWIFGRHGYVPALGLWKMVDNLRRAWVPVAGVGLVLGASALSPSLLVPSLLVVFAMAMSPALARVTSLALRPPSGKLANASRIFGRELLLDAVRALVTLAFLLDTAFLALDAATRTLYRLVISRRRLLQWTSMSHVEGLSRGDPRALDARLVRSAALALCAAAYVIVAQPAASSALLLVAPFGVAPWLERWLRRSSLPRRRRRALDADARTHLRKLARRTFRFFETFVGAEDNFLPPDNFQEWPRGVVAHRTSPTNIGLYLLSCVSAYDLGHIGLRELLDRLDATLSTLPKLRTYRGHLLNWYDTKTLAPLPPAYVSMVDSGNLAGHLWTLAEGLREIVRRPRDLGQCWQATRDCLLLARDEGAEVALALSVLESAIVAPYDDPSGLERALEAVRAARLAADAAPSPVSQDARSWLEEAERTLVSLADERAWIAPFACPSEAVAGAPLPGAESERAGQRCRDLLAEADGLAQRAVDFADAMDFRFLHDGERKLFSIGYEVDAQRLDASRYDLLASEARLGSFLAIAKGDVSEEHWLALGRRRSWAYGTPVLASWSGSMFEYLMPLLVMQNYEGTLLDETYVSVIKAQIRHGAAQGVPWGVSESAYNVMDLWLTYQYRAFGVQALGLKSGLDEERVVAPYATVLSTMVDPDASLRNMEALIREGALGPFGFYEALDYTAGRVPPGKRCVRVRAYMAHHQGMSLVALCNVLLDAPMQRRFHASPRVRAAVLLLEERRPLNSPDSVAATLARTSNAPSLDHDIDPVLLSLPESAAFRVQLLGHGELATLLAADGRGVSTFRGKDVHRHLPDLDTSPSGTFFYLRNRASNLTWSVGLYPTLVQPRSYQVSLLPECITLRRRDGEIETSQEVFVAPEHAAEVRSTTLVNHGLEAVELELTSYVEVTLDVRAADRAHRAFNGMFVRTELVEDPHWPILLAARVPREPDGPVLFAAQALIVEQGNLLARDYDTARESVIGRGGDVFAPRAVVKGVPFAKRVGAVLDAVLAQRVVVRLAAGGEARITFISAISEQRERALDAVRELAHPGVRARAMELAWADARVELRQLGIDRTRCHQYQELLSSLLKPRVNEPRRDAPETAPSDGRGALWSLGISGELRLLVVRMDEEDVLPLCLDAIKAHALFAANHLPIELLLLDEAPMGYFAPRTEAALDAARRENCAHRLDQRGGIFVRQAMRLSADQLRNVFSLADAVLMVSDGTLKRQLRKQRAPLATPPPREQSWATPTLPAALPTPLSLWNGRGGFSADGREYVVTSSADARTPAPWCNVIARPGAGMLVTEVGDSNTWSINSQRRRLTPWSNDVLSDGSGERFWLSDDDSQTRLALTGLARGACVARHGQGYTTLERVWDQLVVSITFFVHPELAAKVSRIEVHNLAKVARSLTLTVLVDWVLGGQRSDALRGVRTRVDGERAILAWNLLSADPYRVAYLTSDGASQKPIDRPAGAGLTVSLRAEPEARTVVHVVMGEAASLEEARLALRTLDRAPALDDALARVRSGWDEILGGLSVVTGDISFDLLVNRWLLYQVLACRIWGRTAFYQSGGAFGFRDQLQDVLAVLHVRPELAREHLLSAAARQFEAGDVQHWWHPETGEGVRTHCSDDFLWLPFATAQYVRVTGDDSVLDVTVPFLHDPPLAAGARDRFGSPPATSEAESLYLHCVSAFKRALQFGEHGLPLMGSGDWNDGMDRVGVAGRGESVWLGWFLARVCQDIRELAHKRSDAETVVLSEVTETRLVAALERYGWDGAWYRRAVDDEGNWIGSSASGECRIDAIAQGWATISGVADRARAEQAVSEAVAQLWDEKLGVLRLLTPPFAHRVPSPGYIAAYPRGVRENGGQYTHGSLWLVQAMFQQGRADEAFAVLSSMLPTRSTDSATKVARYRVEPYAVAADVYGDGEHFGRGGWTWYTGAAGWMYRIAVEDMLGIRLRGDLIELAPHLPSHWPHVEIELRLPQLHYRITIENPAALTCSQAKLQLTLDGRELSGSSVPLVRDGTTHLVNVTLVAR